MSEKYADRIAALLAKAESTTPEEAEALMAKVEELMIKYGIEQAVIDAKRIGATAPEKIITVKVFFGGSYSKGLLSMGHSIAQGLGTVRTLQRAGVRQRNDAGKIVNGDQLYLIGYESDVKLAAMLINSLQLQCVVALAAWWKRNDLVPFMGGMDKFVARRTFIIGFGDGAGRRIKDTYRRVVAEETAKSAGTDLVLVDRRKEVDRYTEETFNPRKARSSSSRYDGGAAGAGREAGGRANVGSRGGAVAGGRKAVTR